MVWRQDEHTVIDVRAVNSLVKNDEIDDPGTGHYPPYVEYLNKCREIAKRCERDLRIVDRAVYEANGRPARTG